MCASGSVICLMRTACIAHHDPPAPTETMIYLVERYPCVVGAAGFMFPQAEQKLPASNVNDVKMKKDAKQTSLLLEL